MFGILAEVGREQAAGTYRRPHTVLYGRNADTNAGEQCLWQSIASQLVNINAYQFSKYGRHQGR